jgi:pimeloyl-ACP methyl ester carboxylesterase
MGTEPMVRDATVTLDGLHFHYRDWGEPAAPPVVLLHAHGQNARSWDTVAQGLADRFRVLALDQRGHGESEHAVNYHELRLVGDLAEFVDALGLARLAIVGFSISASTAASHALLYPDRVERLVLFEGFTEGDEGGAAPWIAEMRAHLATLRSLPEVVTTPEEAAAAFRPLAPHAAEAELVRWVRGGLRQDPDGQWRWRADPIFRQPPTAPGRLNAPPDILRARLAQVQCPSLLLVGEDSWMVEPTEQFAAANPRVRVVQIPQSGHWIPLDNPRGFLAVVSPFLQGDA